MGGGAEMNKRLMQFLNDLAAAGGSSQAILASTAAQAVKGLASAIAAAKQDARALTRPAVTLATGVLEA